MIEHIGMFYQINVDVDWAITIAVHWMTLDGAVVTTIPLLSYIPIRPASLQSGPLYKKQQQIVASTSLLE